MKQTKNSDIQATVFIPASVIQMQAIVSATEFSRYIWTMIVETETDQLQAFSYACTVSHRELHIYFIRNYTDFFFYCIFLNSCSICNLDTPAASRHLQEKQNELDYNSRPSDCRLSLHRCLSLVVPETCVIQAYLEGKKWEGSQSPRQFAYFLIATGFQKCVIFAL